MSYVRLSPQAAALGVGSFPGLRPEDGEHFYPKSLERGVRSERALKLAVAEMYVQGVSTRRVAKITEELCGLHVTSADVSRAAQLLDRELELWRTRLIERLADRPEGFSRDGKLIPGCIYPALNKGTLNRDQEKRRTK